MTLYEIYFITKIRVTQKVNNLKNEIQYH